MNSLTLSASTLEKAVCLRRYWYYRVARRKSAAPKSGADAGSCLHRGFAIWNAGGDTQMQEAAIDRERDARPMVDDTDYRTHAFLKDAFAQLRAVLGEQAASWERLEIEKRGTRLLGMVGDVRVLIDYRRDVVVRDSSAIWVVDLKSASRDDSAEVAAFQNSGQFKAYTWAWNDEHPDTPCAGVQPVRLIMRRPSKTGVAFDVKLDPPARFPAEIIAEWRDSTLRRAADIIARRPEDLFDWPMMDHSSGCCRNQWGCCEYLEVCTLCPADRALKLSTDAFVDSDFGKETP